MAQPTVAQLVDAHAVARRRLATATSDYAAAQARDFGGWYDHAAITAWSARVAVRVEAGQRQVAAITDAYLSRVLTLLLGRRVRPAGTVDVRGGLRAGGVTHPGVYGRVADLYRWRISEGDEPVVALDKAVTRAEVAADTDLQLAFRAQAHRSLADVAEVTGWRRVVHPELSQGGTCGLCIVAASRTYSRSDLMPIHARCCCAVTPVTAAHDPGRDLDQSTLDKLYDAAGSNRAADLKRTRYSVHQHSELGPVLTDAGDHWRGPAEVDAA